MEKEYMEKMKILHIDEKLQPLIEKLWDHNYITIHSCQGGKHNGIDGLDKYITMDSESGDNWFDNKRAKKEGFIIKKYHTSTEQRKKGCSSAIIAYRGTPEGTSCTKEFKKEFIKSEEAFNKRFDNATIILL